MRGAALGLLLCATLPAAAQEMRGLGLGEPVPDTMPRAEVTHVEHPFAYSLWSFDDGLSLSASRDAETGTILFMEIWRSENDRILPAPIDGFFFGQTTRADIVAHFGSEGIVFSRQGQGRTLDELNAYYLAYELQGSGAILAFTTIGPQGPLTREAADAATLDSVILSLGPHLDRVWGPDRTILPGAVPVANPIIAE